MENQDITTRRNRGGRPRKLACERRNFTLHPGYSEAEWNRLEARAEAAGLPAVELVRRLSLDLEIRTLPAANREAIIELGRVGNNINQVARALNAGLIEGLNRDAVEVWQARLLAEIDRIGRALHGHQ